MTRANRKPRVTDCVLEEIPDRVWDVIRRRTNALVKESFHQCADTVNGGALEMAVRSAYLQGVIDGYDALDRASNKQPEYQI